jgi:acyl-CoA dehydrogenase family member 9
VINGLARLGVLGMTAPEEFGGRGFSQLAYCRVTEEIGARCGSTSVFVNAHHSIGIRALLIFGTPEQKRRWLPPLANGEQLAAFALTEPEAGSDAANVQTRAEPDADGSHFILNGEKRYITNAAIARVLTVMARHAGAWHGQDRDHCIPRHARDAGLRNDRAADGKTRHSRHCHRAPRFPRHVRAA